MKKYIITSTMVLAFSVSALAAETSATQNSSPSKISREKMAEAHEKMALCLRSETSVQDCHQEMRAQCHEQEEGCFMMDRMGRGMMGNRKKGKSASDK